MKAIKPVSKPQLIKLLRKFRAQKKKVVFTNGVFDILHRGHVDYLFNAKSFGHVLIVGINTDSSVRKIKGPKRPIQKQTDRAAIVSSLKPVDYVVLFSESTPEKLIELIKPDVLVKGADYKVSEIVGAQFVKSYGGKIKRVGLTNGRSTSGIIGKI